MQSVQQTVERTVNGGGQDTRHKQYVKDVYEEPKKEDRTTDILKRAICIVAALIVLLTVGTGVLVYLDVLDIPPVAKFYDAIGLKPYTNGQNGGRTRPITICPPGRDRTTRRRRPIPSRDWSWSRRAAGVR